MLTMQEIFDTIAVHLLTQKKQAHDGLGRCSYRTAEGLQCAAGCLIKDEFYTPDLEGISVTSVVDSRTVKLHQALINSGVDVYDPKICKMLNKAQLIHDYSSPAFWREKLEKLAREFSLDPSILRSVH